MNNDEIMNMAFAMKMNDSCNEESHSHNNCEHKNQCEDSVQGCYVCEDCGQVMESIISNEADWNSYNVSSGEDNARCGYTSDMQRLMPFQNNMTTISVNKWAPYKQKKLQRWNYSISSKETSKERSFMDVFNKIDEVANRNNIVEIITYSAKCLYVNMASKYLKRGNIRQALIASCLYYAFQINHVYHTIDDVSEMFNIPVRIILTTNKLVSMTIWKDPSLKHIKDALNDTKVESSNISRYASLLKLSNKQSMHAERLYIKFMDENEFLQNKDVTYTFAISLYQTSLDFKLECTKDEICSVCNMSVVTLNKLLQSVL